MATNKQTRSEYTANGMMALAPVRQTALQQNGWKVGKNFFETTKKRVIINSIKRKV